MSCKDAEKMTQVLNSFFLPRKKSLYNRIAAGDSIAYDEYMDSYIENTYMAIAHLSGIEQEELLTEITAEVFADLWQQRHLFKDNKLLGALLFKSTLKLVFIHLDRLNRWDRINLLRSIIKL